jgi:hypothetical protein
MGHRDEHGDDERRMSEVKVGLIEFFTKSGMA